MNTPNPNRPFGRPSGRHDQIERIRAAQAKAKRNRNKDIAKVVGVVAGVILLNLIIWGALIAMAVFGLSFII